MKIGRLLILISLFFIGFYMYKNGYLDDNTVQENIVNTVQENEDNNETNSYIYSPRDMNVYAMNKLNQYIS